MVGSMALGGRFELRLANGGPPPGPFGFTAPLPPLLGGGGRGYSRFLVVVVILAILINLEGLGKRYTHVLAGCMR